jgi:hypothetical protein
VAAAAAGGAVGELLDFVKGFQHIIKLIDLVKGRLDVVIGHLLAVADHNVFAHKTVPPKSVKLVRTMSVSVFYSSIA